MYRLNNMSGKVWGADEFKTAMSYPEKGNFRVQALKLHAMTLAIGSSMAARAGKDWQGLRPRVPRQGAAKVGQPMHHLHKLTLQSTNDQLSGCCMMQVWLMMLSCAIGQN